MTHSKEVRTVSSLLRLLKVAVSYMTHSKEVRAVSRPSPDCVKAIRCADCPPSLFPRLSLPPLPTAISMHLLQQFWDGLWRLGNQSRLDSARPFRRGIRNLARQWRGRQCVLCVAAPRLLIVRTQLAPKSNSLSWGEV